MLLSPAVKTSYLNSMASASSPSPNPKRRHEGEEDHLASATLPGKRARPMIGLRGSRSSQLGQPFQQQQQHNSYAVGSSDIAMDHSHASQQRDTFTHSSFYNKGKAPASMTFTNNNPHWLKVVTSYGYTFVKSDELHLLEGNNDIQMVVEACPSSSNEMPSSPPQQMRFPMGVEFPPTPSPSDDGSGTRDHRFFGPGQSSKALWEQVEGDKELSAQGSMNEMMMDDW